MKIRWVQATNFRKFVGTVRVEGIGDGINVLDGHNEIGKSTLMEAINGVNNVSPSHPGCSTPALLPFCGTRSTT